MLAISGFEALVWQWGVLWQKAAGFWQKNLASNTLDITIASILDLDYLTRELNDDHSERIHFRQKDGLGCQWWKDVDNCVCVVCKTTDYNLYLSDQLDLSFAERTHFSWKGNCSTCVCINIYVNTWWKYQSYRLITEESSHPFHICTSLVHKDTYVLLCTQDDSTLYAY
jgi:hypothetical protein